MLDTRLTPGYREPTESHIPSEWTKVRLGNVASIVGGGRTRVTKESHYRLSGYPAYSAAGQDGFVDRWEFDANAVVIPSIGSIGRAYRAEGRWITLANTQVIFPRGDRLNHAFLHHRVDDTEYWPVSGTAQPFIKPSDIGRCWLILPPIGEQTRIAAILDTLDDTIRQTEQVIAKLQQMKQGLLHDLLTKGIDENGEVRDMPDPVWLRPGWMKPEIRHLPPGWRAVQLGSICRTVGGGKLGLTKEQDYRPEGFPAFSAAGQDGFVATAEFRNRDAVILSAIGAQCGKCFLAEGDWTTLANVQAILVGSELRARFLNYRSNVDDYWPRSGSAQPFIKPSEIGKNWIALPSVPEQERIISVIDGVAERIAREQSQLHGFNQVKAGLIFDLLTGRVRVPATTEVSA